MHSSVLWILKNWLAHRKMVILLLDILYENHERIMFLHSLSSHCLIIVSMPKKVLKNYNFFLILINPFSSELLIFSEIYCI